VQPPKTNASVEAESEGQVRDDKERMNVKVKRSEELVVLPISRQALRETQREARDMEANLSPWL
jgi:hypothetical protein